MAIGLQLIDQRAREDQHIAGRARQQRVALQAHRTKAPLYLVASVLCEGGLQPAHQAQRGAAAQQMNRHGVDSTLTRA